MICRATPELLGRVLALATPDVRADLVRLAGRGYAEVIGQALKASTMNWCSTVPEGPLCVGGIVSIEPRYGSAWMIASPLIARHKKTYLRDSLEQFARFGDEFDIVSTIVESKYAPSLRWLEWLGFTVSGPEALTRAGATTLCHTATWRRA